MVRPSISTWSLLDAVVLKPRAAIAQVWPSARATSRPVARRSASGSEVTPARRMSSPVTTVIAAVAAERGGETGGGGGDAERPADVGGGELHPHPHLTRPSRRRPAGAQSDPTS